MKKSTFKINKLYKYEDIIGKSIPYKGNISFMENGVFVTEYKSPKQYLLAGNYKLTYKNHDVRAIKVKYKNKPLFNDLSGTVLIKNEIEKFLKNFSIYTSRNIIPRRSVLFYSPPGQGKTSAISQAVTQVADKHTAIINWNCGTPSESEVFDWFSTSMQFHKTIKKLIFVIEDLGGTWEANHVDVTSLLNLLDGSVNIFTVPTMIIATTNHPEKLVESIANRPGRFDVVKGMPNLTGGEIERLCKFYAGSLIDVDKETGFDSRSINWEKYTTLTIAHIEEAVNKCLLDKISLERSLYDMLQFDKRFENSFNEKKGKIGLE